MSLTRRQLLRYLIAAGLCLSTSPVLSSEKSKRLHRTIPSSGEKIPVIGLGSWLVFAIDPDDEKQLASRTAIIDEFLKLGGGMLDSSPMYGVAQEVIGKSLARIGHSDGLFSATKVWTRGDRAAFLQMDESMRLWGLEKLDLMQVHNLVDWQRHLPTLHQMKEEGLIRYVGVTTSHGRRHEQLRHIMKTQSLDFVQFTYNLLDREAEQYLLPMAQDEGIAVIINRPFRRGALFERFAHYPLPEWAADINCSNWAQFFLKFVISHPAVSCAIPATSQLAHLRENMGAAYGLMPDEVMREKMSRYIRSL